MKTKYIAAIIGTVCAAYLGYTLWNVPTSQSLPTTPILPHNQAFSGLSGWDQADLKPSFAAFQNSCQLFLRLNPEKSVGNGHFSLKAKDWQPVCHAAASVDGHSQSQVRAFFETWFKPVTVDSSSSKFTGYYAATVDGSRFQAGRYNTPIYSDRHRVLAWVSSDKDRRTLITEGSAIVEFTDGTQKAIEYTKGHQFQETPDHQFHGALDVTLTPGYSMAVDRNWVPLGTPLWLSTQVRQDFSQKAQPFHRLMIAQDVGNMIRGAVRGDMYWGSGKQATKIASNIRTEGSYVLLLPKNVRG